MSDEKTPRPTADSARIAELGADNERLRELLAAAGRLAEFGRFAAQQIHELRQPLFAIKGLSQLLLEKERVELDEVLDFARHISDQVGAPDRAGLGPAPALGAGAAPTKRRTDFGPILVRVTSLLEYRLRKTGATMRTHVAPDLPPLAATPHGLEQILINLIGNALDAVAGVAAPGRSRCARSASRARSAAGGDRDRRQRLGRRQDRAREAVRDVSSRPRARNRAPAWAWRSAARSRAAWAAT